MPHPARFGLGEAAITATLLSIYLSARGTNRALGVVQAAMGGLERSPGEVAPGSGARVGVAGARMGR